MSLKGTQGIIQFQWKRVVLGFWDMILSRPKATLNESSYKMHPKNHKLKVVDEP